MQPPPELLGWSHQFHPGLFFISVIISKDADTAPDPTLKDSSESLSYRLFFDGALA